ncbi:Flowering time control protein FCA [Cardamine amara subsp. amara]|uniref:Flowering time control protein FCA n=1 Tax=Cardamine amara subsp. amara TaxID=228776 RepID=A0ABD0ZJ59_CARAN
MNRFEEDDEAFSRRRRRGNSPSNYRIGIGGGGDGDRRWEGDGPKDFNGPVEGVGGFRQMNGPPDRIDFHHHGGSLPPMGFAFDGGFRPMSPNGSVGGEEKRSIVGAGGGGGGFRLGGPVKFPPSESPDGGRFIGKVMESDYSVRPTPPPVQPSLSGQKRGHHSLSEHESFTGTDVSDHSSIVKLFVGSVPRTATEEEVRPFFEQHGNVLEVALIKDKRTGQQQGCCFVKYATSRDADRAIRALHNQITLPRGTGPVQVRYADGERERIGTLEFKLFVGSLNKQATEKEVEEIFLQFGRLEDVYLMRDEYRQSRGCGFVKYSSKETAMAAINGLNGTYTMRGCSQPLIVRFADPKRPKPGESRDVAPPVGLGSGPRFQASGPRPTSKLGDPIGDVSHTKPWRPTNLPNIGPPTNTGIRGIGSDFSSRPGQATLPSNKAGPLGGYGVPPLNPLPLSGGSSSATSQQQNRAAGQKISPLQKSLHSPQDIPLRPQSNFPGVQASLQNPYGYSSQLPTSQLPQQNITPATAPQTNLNINLRPTTVSSATDQFLPRAQQQPLQNMQHPPSELAKLLSQQTQSLQATLQSSQQAISQLQQQVQSMQQPNQNLPVSQNGQPGKQQWGGSSIPKVVSTTGSTPVSYVQTAAPTVSQSVVSVKCNWTEHTSPDGFKYYYNGLTGESKWEKPEEMVVFERQQQHQQKPTIHQPQTLLQPMQQQPQQQPQTQLQPIQQQPQQQPQTQLQPIHKQPQQVNQQYQGQQLQQPFYSSLYSTPGVSHNAQYPSLAVSQNSQFPMSGIGQNAQEYGRTHIPVGAASMNDLSRTEQVHEMRS